MCIGKNYIQGSVLSVVSGIYWGSWNVFLQLWGDSAVIVFKIGLFFSWGWGALIAIMTPKQDSEKIATLEFFQRTFQLP